MLQPALAHKSSLEVAFLRVAYNDKYKFSQVTGFRNLVPKLDDSDWNNIQTVSVSTDGVLLGYMHAAVDRESNIVTGLQFMCFVDHPSLEWSQDMLEFFERLFTQLGFHKVSWTVVVGNPAEALWDKVCEKYNGRVVGTKCEDVKLSDGKLYDLKLYEVMNSMSINNGSL